MAKRKETIKLENALFEFVKNKRIYGCEEVTIGFHNAGKGNEIVDFITMDSKGIIKCYELKVTLEDLKSKAKKSWYGHYNYLLVTQELYDKIDDWSVYVPSFVGIIVGESLVSKKNAKKQNIGADNEIMLKESMVRSLFYKMNKYKEIAVSNNGTKMQSRIKSLERYNKKLHKQYSEQNNMISQLETYCELNNGKHYSLDEMVKYEKNKFRQSRQK